MTRVAFDASKERIYIIFPVFENPEEGLVKIQ